MLSFESFRAYVEAELPRYLSADMGEVEVARCNVTKNNDMVCRGLTVRQKDNPLGVNVYLEKSYEDWCDGTNLDEVLKNIADTAKEGLENAPSAVTQLTRQFEDFEYIKELIVMQVCNTAQNKTMLANVPHQEREDLSIIYKISLGFEDGGTGTALVTNKHMELWNITPQELHQLAEDNTKRLYPTSVQSVSEVLQSIGFFDALPNEARDQVLQEMSGAEMLYVITNQKRMSGAVALFDMDALSGLASSLESDLYILPSSVHEVLAIRSSDFEVEELVSMVRGVNQTQVSPEERLSDHVYYFNAREKRLTLADTTMEQIEKETQLQKSMQGSTPKNDRPRQHI